MSESQICDGCHGRDSGTYSGLYIATCPRCVGEQERMARDLVVSRHVEHLAGIRVSGTRRMYVEALPDDVRDAVKFGDLAWWAAMRQRGDR